MNTLSAAMAELADALDSGSSRGNSVDVRVILAAIKRIFMAIHAISFPDGVGVPDSIEQMQQSRRTVENRIRTIQKDLMAQSRASRYLVGFDRETCKPAEDLFLATVASKKALIEEKDRLTKLIETEVDYTYCVMDLKSDCGVKASAPFEIQASRVDGYILTLWFTGPKSESKPRLYLGNIVPPVIRAELVVAPGSSQPVPQEASINIEDYISIGQELRLKTLTLEIVGSESTHAVSVRYA
jgi:hypothetical protein